MSSSIEAYVAKVDAEHAQRLRVVGAATGDRWGGGMAQRLSADMSRALSPHMTYVASLLRQDDVLLDIGGGAGRNALPLASHCAEVIDIDPSPGMRAQFEATAAAAGITNARFVQADWVTATGVTGDVALVAHVTYFVRDIEPFVRKLHAASRRLVVISVLSEPMPNRYADFFRMFHGEAKAELPGYRNLLPVLWELGLLPEVRVFRSELVASRAAPNREEAVRQALDGGWLREDQTEQARTMIEARFDELFVQDQQGVHVRRIHGLKEVLVTWDTGRPLA
ncbi:MAG: class I SAM-dependent methyltransferase [Chloroflexota bacterium]